MRARVRRICCRTFEGWTHPQSKFGPPGAGAYGPNTIWTKQPKVRKSRLTAGLSRTSTHFEALPAKFQVLLGGGRRRSSSIIARTT